MSLGKTMLGRRHVLPSVASSLKELQVEGTFPTGTYLVTVHWPIASENGDLERALYGSFLPVPDPATTEFYPSVTSEDYLPERQPGAVVVVAAGNNDGDDGAAANSTIQLNEGRERRSLAVVSKGDRPIQVGSHYHFIETNPQLEFDRIRAREFRLDIPAGTSVRFEPGDSKTVTLVRIAGRQIAKGGNGISSRAARPDGGGEGAGEEVSDEVVSQRIRDGGFLHKPEAEPEASEDHPPAGATMDRHAYMAMFGPTTGDRIRLGSTALWIKVERDASAASYGDECTFGGGKTVREGMGQAGGVADADSLDTVITNAVIVDWSGVFKADVGIKNGRICALGKAGNPDIMHGVHPNLVVGACTDVIAAEGLILTAGGIDSHIHFICPQQATEAIASGVTTMIGGGTGPSTGTNATTCTPGANHIRHMLQACDHLPLNFAITGKGNDSERGPLREQCEAGVVGLKLHEDWGSTPSAIDACLSVCDEYDVQCLIHTDTLNESGFVEQTIAAFKGRTIHTYHTEGAGGGHAPDIISVVGQANVLPSSTNPTRPYTINTLDEHLDMLMVCHHLSREISEDVAFAESRIRAETIAAEDVLQDSGAIAMLSSDSQAMGRVGEVIIRAWNTAHKNRVQRGPLPEDAGSGADNFRARRYVAKYTINPAVAHGMAHLIGSVEPEKLADLVLWDPACFGAKPKLVLKGGMIAYGQMGDPNASIPTVQPILMRPMFAPFVPETCVTFVSQASIASGAVASYGLRKPVVAVQGCRSVSKRDMKLNDSLPRMRVDPESYTVEADGEVCTAEPAESLPLTQAYFVF